MTIKCYFDCSWTGPEATVDESGKITHTDKASKGKKNLQRLRFIHRMAFVWAVNLTKFT